VDASGGLPDIPVNDLVIDPAMPGTVYLATDLGVFQGSCTAGACVWTTLNNNSLPNVAVLSLRIHNPSRTLRAATHGRGMWDLALPGGATFGISSIAPNSANAGQPDITNFVVNGSGFTANSTIVFTINGSATTITPSANTSTQLTATIPAAELQAQGVAQVTVSDAGQTTNAMAFPVLVLAPSVTALNPFTTPVQANPANPLLVTITGINLTANTTVVLNPFYSGPGGKVKLAATLGSGQLSVNIPANVLGPFGSTNDIQVSTAPPGGGVAFPVSFKVLAPVPANDSFGNAIDLATLTSPNIQDTSAATSDANDPVPPCGQLASLPAGSITFGNANSIWYKFTPATNGNLNLSLAGSGFAGWLSVWTGASQSALTLVPNACSGFPVSNLATEPQVSNISLAGGTTYYIMVGSAGPTGSGVLVSSTVPNPIALGGKSVLNFSFAGSPDFSFTVAAGQGSQTVNAGQTATFNNVLTVNGANGFVGSVAASCSLPTAIAATTTCTVQPSTINAGQAASVVVTTTARGLAPVNLWNRRFFSWPRAIPLLLLTALLCFLLTRLARTRRQRLAVVVPMAGLVLFVLLQAVGCGGSSQPPPPPPPTGTQVGTYTIAVTGTAAGTNTTHATTLQLIVN
jgi:hypothetical protein